MGVTAKIKWVIWIGWIILFPLGLYYSYSVDPPDISSWWIPAGLVTLAIIVSLFPFKVDKSTIFIIHWVNLAAFLTYGLFFELILMQIVLIPLLIKSKLTFKTIYRYALNSLMFLIISIAAGTVFYALDVQIGQDSLGFITLASAVYIFIHIGLNHLYLYSFSLLIKKRNPFFSNDTVLDYMATMLSMPYGLAFYYLLNDIGIAAILFIGIPFLAVTIVLRLYNTSEKVNEVLAHAGKIGHQLAARLEVNEVIDLFLKRLSELLPVDYAYILAVENNENQLVLLRKYENGVISTANLGPIHKGEGISGRIWESGNTRLYNKKQEWNEEAEGYMPVDIESILSVPIQRDKNTVAVLLVASKRKNAYRTHLVPIVDLLCSYFAVAIENARSHQRTIVKSERCALTGLYNYRYFDERLHHEFERLLNGRLRQLSLILLDIDHFKKVNDTYGHQSGNDLLQALSQLLVNFIGDKGIVARYGGEEFVVLLCDIPKHEALTIAEDIRISVENTVFETHNDLSKDREDINVKLTISVGVSTAPEDTDSAKNLLRNADRALYIGAKQKGRNRVAEYSK